jgi:hypothetical protein
LIGVDECVICGCTILRQKPGVVSPFLAKRIWERRPFPVALAECSDCGFKFFNPRLEATEEERLYVGYRSPEYQTMRQSFEPWYTEKLNASISSPESWRTRKSLLASLFRERLNLDGRTFDSVLDFGGDRGDLIAKLFPGSRRFVYEISGVRPITGVETLRTLEECRRYPIDLIITSNVLEHVGSPREVISQIASIAGPQTLVFNEVPLESPTDWRSRLKRLVQAGILSIARPALAWQVTGPGVFNLMHEHVNYFSQRSLDRLMQVSGFDVVTSDDYVVFGGFLGLRMVWNLAQKK